VNGICCFSSNDIATPVVGASPMERIGFVRYRLAVISGKSELITHGNAPSGTRALGGQWHGNQSSVKQVVCSLSGRPPIVISQTWRQVLDRQQLRQAQPQSLSSILCADYFHSRNLSRGSARRDSSIVNTRRLALATRFFSLLWDRRRNYFRGGSIGCFARLLECKKFLGGQRL
jgi:hypothetical protein